MGDIAPEGYGGPGEQMNVYYENPFEDLHDHQQVQDEYLQKFTMVCTEEERRILREDGERFRNNMHELGLRKCRGGPWVTEAAYLANYASSKRTLTPMEHKVVATIEEPSDDTPSHVSTPTKETAQLTNQNGEQLSCVFHTKNGCVSKR